METSAPGIAGAIDGCSPLAIPQYEAVLRQAAAQLGQPVIHFLQELNADRLRVVRDSSLSFSLSKLSEEHVQPTQVEQRLAMCVVAHGDLAHKAGGAGAVAEGGRGRRLPNLAAPAEECRAVKCEILLNLLAAPAAQEARGLAAGLSRTACSTRAMRSRAGVGVHATNTVMRGPYP